MSDSVISPDGKWIWNGTDWIPLQPLSNTNVQDSIVMGDVNTKIEHSVKNTYTQDTEKSVRNHLNLVAEKMGLGLFDQADEIYEKAKHIDYQLAIELYNGEFCEIFISAIWEELSQYKKKDELIIEDRISRILKFDKNHIPSLQLMFEMSLEYAQKNVLQAGYSGINKAELDCNKILAVDPKNEMALNGIETINFLKKVRFIGKVTLSAVLILVGIGISLSSI